MDDLKTLKHITGVKTNVTQQRLEFEAIFGEVEEELERASAEFGPFRSPHEGYAILKEEVDELWDDVKCSAPTECMRAEAIQVAAMAVRFVYDICYRRWDGDGSAP